MATCKHPGCEEGHYCFGFHQYLDEYGDWNGDGEYDWGACPCCGGNDWENCPNCTPPKYVTQGEPE